jgi:hypothetical protein
MIYSDACLVDLLRSVSICVLVLRQSVNGDGDGPATRPNSFMDCTENRSCHYFWHAQRVHVFNVRTLNTL